ncbi:MAG: glycosyltransferase family 4 protein [Aequorivita sp.]
MKKLLVIGHTFPEPKTTAAGIRMMQLLDLFLAEGFDSNAENFQITFATTATGTERSADLQAQNISIKNILLNDSSFDGFAKELNPDVVIFDRYISEEQFGWRITENCPRALKILDTEDLHFLRKAREEAIKKGESFSDTELFTETAKRELASILRCDLSLIISEYEMDLLQKTFAIKSEILYYLPLFSEDSPKEKPIPSFEARENFLAIGNLLHAPNVDAVLQLKSLWPKIKSQLPAVELHIYGDYAPRQILELDNKQEGFRIMGWAEDVERLMVSYRMQLAPIRFGAGLKGKLLDAMHYGLPSITTQVGAEGLSGNLPFGGKIAFSNEEFINAAVQFYSDETLWKEAQQNGFDIVQARFQKKNFNSPFKKRIKFLLENLEQHRRKNFIGQILQHHSLQASKYMSKWIEVKNTLPQNASPVCYANSDEVREEYK